MEATDTTATPGNHRIFAGNNRKNIKFFMYITIIVYRIFENISKLLESIRISITKRNKFPKNPTEFWRFNMKIRQTLTDDLRNLNNKKPGHDSVTSRPGRSIRANPVPSGGDRSGRVPIRQKTPG
ncbi:hypothetical protein ACFONL_15325 [Camelimonas fluminis]|uniref:Uncharacterized protein n=1 Tax=Camelimonas fluminis TaxID=1576911 RepID=A0ABV7UKP1_9HYPH|nr:hypothetical protein [Camelimonas fluminis]